MKILSERITKEQEHDPQIRTDISKAKAGAVAVARQQCEEEICAKFVAKKLLCLCLEKRFFFAEEVEERLQVFGSDARSQRLGGWWSVEGMRRWFLDSESR